jgi:hypothetical protein
MFAAKLQVRGISNLERVIARSEIPCLRFGTGSAILVRLVGR